MKKNKKIDLISINYFYTLNEFHLFFILLYNN